MKYACATLMFLALGAAATGAKAQSANPEVSFNLGLTSDYVFRGFSQSDEKPAVQGGVDVAAGSFYAGAWASTVEFGDGTDAEFDIYGGWLTTVSGFDLDFGVTSYHYIGAPNGAGYDFVEFKAAAARGFGPVTAGASIAWSPDFYGADEAATYAELSLGFDATDKLSFAAAVGQQWLDVGDDYNTWNVGASYALTNELSADVRYHDTDVDGPLSDGRVTVTLGVAF